jgi:hypothetical protein
LSARTTTEAKKPQFAQASLDLSRLPAQDSACARTRSGKSGGTDSLRSTRPSPSVRRRSGRRTGLRGEPLRLRLSLRLVPHASERGVGVAKEVPGGRGTYGWCRDPGVPGEWASLPLGPCTASQKGGDMAAHRPGSIAPCRRWRRNTTDGDQTVGAVHDFGHWTNGLIHKPYEQPRTGRALGEMFAS